jgi:hypothetical protein
MVQKKEEMTQLTEREVDELMTRVWERIRIKLVHAEILMTYNPMEDMLDKCKCGKNKPPKK